MRKKTLISPARLLIAVCTALLTSLSQANEVRWLSGVVRSDTVLNQLQNEEECLINVTRRFELDLGLFLAVLRTEGAKTNFSRWNTNNTKDYGPAQINSVWIKRFRQFGIPANSYLLKHHTCFNLTAGAWILRYEMDRAKSFWDGVGHYHSRTPHLKKAYIRRVYNNWQTIMKIARQ